MQAVDPAQSASKILELLCEKLQSIRFLAKGATCNVWEVVSDKRSYALRIIEAKGRVLDGSVDQFLRQQVLIQRGDVAEPVLCSETSPDILKDTRWNLEVFIEGNHPERGRLTEETCTALGKTLAILHQIPTQKCGKPSHIDAGVLVGEQFASLAGVNQRFENPLPDSWAAGFEHPILLIAPEIKPDVIGHSREVTDALSDRSNVLCHTDIHEKQLICSNGRLAALIDFGGATILNLHWDLASVLYFHGSANFEMVQSAYSGQFCVTVCEKKLVRSFAIAIAMHHASRSTKPGKQHRLQRALNFIRATISE